MQSGIVLLIVLLHVNQDFLQFHDVSPFKMHPIVIFQVQFLLELFQGQLRKATIVMHNGSGPRVLRTNYHRSRSLIPINDYAIVAFDSSSCHIVHEETGGHESCINSCICIGPRAFTSKACRWPKSQSIQLGFRIQPALKHCWRHFHHAPSFG